MTKKRDSNIKLIALKNSLIYRCACSVAKFPSTASEFSSEMFILYNGEMFYIFASDLHAFLFFFGRSIYYSTLRGGFHV